MVNIDQDTSSDGLPPFALTAISMAATKPTELQADQGLDATERGATVRYFFAIHDAPEDGKLSGDLNVTCIVCWKSYDSDGTPCSLAFYPMNRDYPVTLSQAHQVVRERWEGTDNLVTWEWFPDIDELLGVFADIGQSRVFRFAPHFGGALARRLLNLPSRTRENKDKVGIRLWHNAAQNIWRVVVSCALSPVTMRFRMSTGTTKPFHYGVPTVTFQTFDAGLDTQSFPRMPMIVAQQWNTTPIQWSGAALPDAIYDPLIKKGLLAEVLASVSLPIRQFWDTVDAHIVKDDPADDQDNNLV